MSLHTETIGSFSIVPSPTESGGEGGLDEHACQYKIISVKKLSRNSSGIWSYFGIAKKENTSSSDVKGKKSSDRILCLLCFQKGTVHVYKRNTSSGNLWRHVQRKHGITIPKDRAFATAVNVKTNAEDNNYKNQCDDDDVTTFTTTEFVEIENSKIHTKVGNISNDYFKPEKCDVFKDIGSLLIEEVAKRPELYEWSPTLSGKKARRAALWHEIYEALGRVMQIDRLQKMWKNIRDRYRKVKKQGSMDATRRYKYYAQLQFLDLEDGRGNDVDAESSVDYLHLSDDESMDYDHLVKKKKSDVEINENFDSVPANEFKAVDITKLISGEYSSSTAELKSRRNVDEFDLFGKLIAEKLRKLPSSRVNQLEINILQMMGNEECSNE